MEDYYDNSYDQIASNELAERIDKLSLEHKIDNLIKEKRAKVIEFIKEKYPEEFI